MNIKKSTLRYSLLLIFIIHVLSLLAYDKQTVMVAMRDEIRLATDIYKPNTSSPPWPVVLVRTPYNRKSGMEDWMLALLADLRGYALVLQDLRGRYDSEGIDSLFFSDGWGRVWDGYDTIEWIANQSWSNGKIGTWGASGLGIPQYLTAGTRPPHLTCACVIVSASNIYSDALFYGGEYQKSLVDDWLTEQDAEYLIDFFIEYPDYGSAYYSVDLSTRYDSVNVPILHIGGWHDIFIQGMINAFCGIQDQGGPDAAGHQKLIVGPWVHDIQTVSTGELTFPNSNAMTLFLSPMLDWFDYWLKNVPNGAEHIPAVQYYLMGDPERTDSPGNRWIERADWPPQDETIPFYFRSGEILSTEKPKNAEPSESFDFDPEYFVSTVGGRNLNLPAGSYDQRSVESRSDVLVYTTDPLIDSVTITGRIKVTIWASSDALDTDFTAKLCDVYPDGRSMLIADGIVQARHRNSLSIEELLIPDEINRFEIDLWSTAVVFAPEHAIRLSISSSNYPRFETNPNTGEPFRKNTSTRIAHQTLYHDADHPSAILLPVLDGSQLPGQPVQPTDYVLEQNYPNPFNSETLISLFIPHGENSASLSSNDIQLEIFDLRGHRLKEWNIPPGDQKRITIRWRGDDSNGIRLPSGIYFCQLKINNIKSIRKMTILK